MAEKKSQGDTRPTSINLTPKGKEALDEIVRYLQSTLPAGIRITTSEVIENALLEKRERIKQKAK